MQKVDKTVKKETLYVAVSAGLMSCLMQAVFLIIGFWDYTVLLGNLWGVFMAILNFFLMGLTVQKAVLKEKKEAANMVKFSQTARLFLLLIMAIIGVVIPVFNIFAVLIPLLFPRIWFILRPNFNKNK